MENTRREEAPCAVCGTNRFSIDALGFKFCIYGHQVEGFQEEGLDFDQLGTMKRIYVNKGKRKQQANDFYFGSNYKFLQLQLFQYVLHLQCQYLIENHGFPKEFEDAVKEIFLLFINWNDELYIDVDKLGHPVPRKLNVLVKDQTEKDLEDMEMSSSNDESDDEVEKNKEKPTKFKGNRHLHGIKIFKEGKPKKIGEMTLPWTLSFLYLGAKSVNLDILLLDLQQLALNNQLPYRNITSQIPESYYERYKFYALMSGTIPTHEKLEQLTAYISIVMLENYEIKFSPLNPALVIYRICSHFELPPIYFNSVYYIYLKLGIYTSYDKFESKGTPMSNLLAVFIIVLKLVFGFDGHLRYPDPIFKLESTNCDEILTKFETLNKNYFDKLKPKDITEYIERFQQNSDETVNKLKELFEEDNYQRYEPGAHKKTMIDGTPNNVIMRLLKSTNETNQSPETNNTSFTSKSNSALKLSINPPDSELIEPGANYSIFPASVTNYSDLPSYYLRLLTVVSDYSQLSLFKLGVAVKFIENELFKLEN